MVHINITFFVFLCTVVVSACVYAHGDGIHHHSDPHDHHDHHHHFGHFHHHESQDSRQVRTGRRKLVNSTTSFSTDGGRCGTLDPSSERMAESSRIVQKWIESPNSRQATTINVNTYFHIVTAEEDNVTVGNLSDTDVINQLQVLNDSFRPYGFSFTLMGTTRNNNSDWFYGDYFAMKSALRVGDASTLNVYFVDLGGLAGFATFPWSYELEPKDDGVVIDFGTIPGGSVVRYNEGKTLVHEVGHWLGLFHTFQIDPNINFLRAYLLFSIIGDLAYCRYNTDEVRDTPKQQYPTRGCPIGRNSCVLNRGLDPIHNYMDYSDDFCYTEFSNGQMNRMKAMWNEYRAL
jgi:hypothetical protein